MIADIKTRRDSILESLKDSNNLSAQDKNYFSALINETAENTNGRNVEEKVQGLSLALFHLTSLFIIDKIDKREQPDNKWDGLFAMIDNCKWAICVIVGIVSTLLIFRPQLADIIAQAIR